MASNPLAPPTAKKPRKAIGPSAGEAAQEQELLALARSIRSKASSAFRRAEPIQDPDIHLRRPEPKPEVTKDGFTKPMMLEPKNKPSIISAPKLSRERSKDLRKPAPRKASVKNIDAPKLKYDEPFWSALPAAEFGFDILKNGTIVSEFPIDLKPFIVVGRHPSCDLVLQHQSISRQHCVLQHREGGLVYLYELGSTHGTKVNKKKIPPRDHFQINIGDVIKFGESSRLYILTGPDDLAPVAPERVLPEHVRMKMRMAKQRQAEEKKKKDMAEKMDLTEMTWGMGDEERMTSLYEKDDPLEGFKPKTDRQKKLWERIEAKQRKIDNIKIEMSTLSKKRSVQGELTEGQERALQRCETRISQLGEIIESIKETLREELDLAYRRSTGTSLKKKRKKLLKKARQAALSDSDDDFYDRTQSTRTKESAAKNKIANFSAGGEDRMAAARLDIASLKKEIEGIVAKKTKLEMYIQSVRREEKKKGKVDSLDAFMNTVDQSLKSESARRSQKELSVLQDKLKHYQTALAFKQKQQSGSAKAGFSLPAIQNKKRTFRRSDMPAPAKVESDEEAEEDYRMKKVTDTGRPDSARAESVSSVLSRMPKMKKKIEKEIEERKRLALEGFEAGPKRRNKDKKKSKKKEIKSRVEEKDVEGSENKEEDDSGEAPVPKLDNDTLRERYKALFDKMRRDEETAATLTRLPGVQKDDQVGLIIRKKKRPKDEENKSAGDRRAKVPRRSKIGPAVVPMSTGEDTAQWQDIAWAPPKNQSGDGRTHLNEKFGY
ncbi:hypothetical protein AAMO2058_000648700 [Amorphochlora amoebiformis]